MLSEFRSQKKHKLSLFSRRMIVAGAGCLCAVIGILVFLWSYLADFEAHTPKYYALEYIELLKKEEYAQAMELVNLKETELVSVSDFADYIKKIFPDGFDDIKIYETSQENANTRTCNLYAGNQKRSSLCFTDSGKKSRHHFTEWVLSLSDLPDTDYVITAPVFVNVKVNGQLLTAEQGEQETQTEFTGMEETSVAPQTVTYHVSGLLKEPQVTAIFPDGKQYEVNISLEENRFTVNISPETSVGEVFTRTAIEDAKIYAQFITKDASFTQLSKRLYPNTEFYRNMSSFFNGWYNKHETNGFENIKSENLRLLDEDAFAIDVSFDYYVVKSGKRHDFPTKYTLAYHNTDTGWKLVNVLVK